MFFKNRALNELPFSVEALLVEMAKANQVTLNGFELLTTKPRPFSTLYKINLKLDGAESSVIYLKFFRLYAEKEQPENVVRDYETTRFWHNKFSGHDSFKVVKPLYCDAEKYVIITEESKGQDLSNLVEKYFQIFPKLHFREQLNGRLEQVGKWLRYFQSIAVENESEDLTLQSLIEYIDIRLRGLVANPKVQFDDPMRLNILDYFRLLWKDVLPADLKKCYMHSDLSLSNVLVDDASITVLDFNKIDVGSRFKDPARFYHQLHLLENKPMFRRSLIADLKKSFLKGYGEELLERHPLFKIYLMIHHISHLGKSARYWEHSFIENLYNRWVVRNSLRMLRSVMAQ